LLTIAIITVAALTSGCASGPDRTERDFGNSVRAMNRSQTIDLTKTVAPDTTPVDATDGQRMDIALQSYRESVGNPAKVTGAPIRMNITE
jgi:hypothetical protein